MNMARDWGTNYLIKFDNIRIMRFDLNEWFRIYHTWFLTKHVFKSLSEGRWVILLDNINCYLARLLVWILWPCLENTTSHIWHLVCQYGQRGGIRNYWPGQHDDVIKWKHFPRYWPVVRGIHRPRWNPRTKAGGAEFWCFLWSASE